MLDLLLTGGGTATTLSERLPVSRQAVAKHLGVLDRVGLVQVTPSGRERRYEVDEAQFARAVAQLSSVGSAWDRPTRSASSGSRRRSSAPRRTEGLAHLTDSVATPVAASMKRAPEPGADTERGSPTWWTSCTGSESRQSPEDVYSRPDHDRRAQGLVDGDHDGRPRPRWRHRVPVRAGPRRLRHEGGGREVRLSWCSGRSSTAPRSGSAPRSASSSSRRTTSRSCCSATWAGGSRWSSCTTAAPSGRRT